LGFFDGKQIHEAIGIDQEGLPTNKVKKMSSFIIKLDLSKAYDRVHWAHLRLMMFHVVFSCEFANCMEGCYSSISFSVLINGYILTFLVVL
jgi:hypothetical protein